MNFDQIDNYSSNMFGSLLIATETQGPSYKLLLLL
jgi:hypothetical protein